MQAVVFDNAPMRQYLAVDLISCDERCDERYNERCDETYDERYEIR